MAKNFIKELVEEVSKSGGSARRDSLAEFLSTQDDLAEAVAAGFRPKTVWVHLKKKGRFTYSYETFRKHLKSHPIKADEVRATSPTTSSGFSYDAKAKKEELL